MQPGRNPLFAALLALYLLVTSFAPMFCCSASADAAIQTTQVAAGVAASTPHEDCDCLCAGDHCACSHSGAVGSLTETPNDPLTRVSSNAAGRCHAPPPRVAQNQLFRPPRV